MGFWFTSKKSRVNCPRKLMVVRGMGIGAVNLVMLWLVGMMGMVKVFTRRTAAGSFTSRTNPTCCTLRHPRFD